MSDFYSDMQRIATDVIGEFAQSGVTLIRVTKGSGRPDRPGNPVETDPVSLNAVVKGVSFNFIDGSTVLATDLELTTPADIDQPIPGDIIVIKARRHVIVKSMAVPAAGTPVTYRLIFRNA